MAELSKVASAAVKKKSRLRTSIIVGLIVCVLLCLLGYIGAGIVLGVLIIGGGSVYAMKSGYATDAYVEEQEKKIADNFNEKIEEARKKRDKLNNMRIRDPEVGEAIKGFGRVYNDYITACVRTNLRDPDADICADEVLKVLDIFLNEQDGSLLEGQLGIEDTDKFDNPKDRTLNYIKKKSAFVRKAKMNLMGGDMGGDDQLKVEEEMMGLKTDDPDYDPLVKEIECITVNAEQDHHAS